MDAAKATKETGHWPSGGTYLDESEGCYRGILRVWREFAEQEAEQVKAEIERIRNSR